MSRTRYQNNAHRAGTICQNGGDSRAIGRACLENPINFLIATEEDLIEDFTRKPELGSWWVKVHHKYLHTIILHRYQLDATTMAETQRFRGYRDWAKEEFKRFLREEVGINHPEVAKILLRLIER